MYPFPPTQIEKTHLRLATMHRTFYWNRQWDNSTQHPRDHPHLTLHRQKDQSRIEILIRGMRALLFIIDLPWKIQTHNLSAFPFMEISSCCSWRKVRNCWVELSTPQMCDTVNAVLENQLAYSDTVGMRDSLSLLTFGREVQQKLKALKHC